MSTEDTDLQYKVNPLAIHPSSEFLEERLCFVVVFSISVASSLPTNKMALMALNSPQCFAETPPLAKTEF